MFLPQRIFSLSMMAIKRFRTISLGQKSRFSESERLSDTFARTSRKPGCHSIFCTHQGHSTLRDYLYNILCPVHSRRLHTTCNHHRYYTHPLPFVRILCLPTGRTVPKRYHIRTCHSAFRTFLRIKTITFGIKSTNPFGRVIVLVKPETFPTGVLHPMICFTHHFARSLFITSRPLSDPAPGLSQRTRSGYTGPWTMPASLSSAVQPAPSRFQPVCRSQRTSCRYRRG